MRRVRFPTLLRNSIDQEGNVSRPIRRRVPHRCDIGWANRLVLDSAWHGNVLAAGWAFCSYDDIPRGWGGGGISMKLLLPQRRRCARIFLEFGTVGTWGESARVLMRAIERGRGYAAWFTSGVSRSFIWDIPFGRAIH